MRIDEVLSNTGRVKIILPVGKKNDAFRAFEKLGINVVDDSAAANNQWMFIVDNRFNKDINRLEEIIRNSLKHTGPLVVSQI